MTIEFRCSQCNQLLRVPDNAAGKSARCPKCQSLMIAPSATAIVVPVDPSLPSASPFAAPSVPYPYATPTLGTKLLYPQAELARPGLPWENRPVSFASWWQTTNLCMTQPSYAFSAMRRTGGMGPPMMFVAVGLSIGALGQLIWGTPLLILISLLAGQGRASPRDIAALAGLQVVAQIFNCVMTVVLGATLGLLVLSAVLHVCLMAVGGTKHPFETTLRTLAFAKGSTVWLNIIPGGLLVALVWLIVLEIVGLARAHEIDQSKSAIAVFLPMIVVCGCFIGFAAVFLGIAIANAN